MTSWWKQGWQALKRLRRLATAQTQATAGPGRAAGPPPTVPAAEAEPPAAPHPNGGPGERQRTATAPPSSRLSAGSTVTAASNPAPVPAPLPATSPPPAPPLKAALPPSTPARFESHRFAWEGQRHAYRLFIPARAAGLPPPPLVVMLHGCKQDAADFARGTGMNALAQAQGCLVLYPEQSARANRMRCWNWFERAHQGHAGEPALIAALTQEVAQAHGADAQRIYIAGLSAGGAMAAVVAALYPGQFAALGVHSGLPAGAAGNVISAFAVMRRGGAPRAFAGRRPGAMPTIVFHGSADEVVHPDNGEQVTAAARAALAASGLSLQCVESEEQVAGRRPARVARWLDGQGVGQLEQWTVAGGLHGWSGGQAEGSFTDPEGPDAAAAMLGFFLQHRRG